MAVIPHRTVYTSREDDTVLVAKVTRFPHHIKAGLELDLSPLDGSKQPLFGHSDDYLSVSPSPLHGLNRVEVRDAQVPEFRSEPSSILDLSTNMSPTLDTPSIIDSIVDVDVLPFRFNNPCGAAPDPVPPAEDIVSAAAASAMLGIDEPERFQDLNDLINDPPMPVVSAPLLSPTGSIYSDVTAGSPSSQLSAASTSRDTAHFFGSDGPDIELLACGSSRDAGRRSLKREGRGDVREGRDQSPEVKVGRYAEMRRRNNIASRRSRQTRREKERDMEQQLRMLQEENVSLKARVKNLEELVEKTKGIILNVVTKRQA